MYSSDCIITDHDSGEAVCSKCGLVISDKIQESQVEGCTPFATDTINVGNSTGYDSGFHTIIGRPNRDKDIKRLDLDLMPYLITKKTIAECR